MHRYETRIHLAETDAAGVLYFANILRLAHEAYEDWFHGAGLSLSTVVRNRPYGLPIVHCEADFKMPLRLGDSLAVVVDVLELGARSYTLTYRFEGPHGLAGTAKTTHVAVSPEAGTSMPIPEEVRQILHRSRSRT
jgi:1,4-dihydroxy-2-naphthoyl-CoA hydrolase